MSSRIPPLLESYLSLPPEASLILLTNVLGASSNWLVLRFLHSTLLSSEAPSEASLEDEPKVLLVSFMRDLTFWKENARRLGLDLDKLTTNKRFAFMDGLIGLFQSKQQKEIGGRNGLKTLGSPEFARISGEIMKAVEELKGGKNGKVLLVVDQIDLLLATGGEKVDAVNLGTMLIGIQEHVHATIMTLASDYPLVSAQHTPLEINHAAFLLNTAHKADLIMSLRLLDTGTARDVSGVVRITIGEQTAFEQQEPSRTIEEKELLYFVGGDGGVKVFERGQ